MLRCGVEPLRPQVVPVRIVGFDECELPFAPPFLDQLFAPYRGTDLRMMLDLDETDRIARDADIHVAAITVRNDVYPAACRHPFHMNRCGAEEKPSPVSSTG